MIGDKGDAGFYFDPTPFSQPQGAHVRQYGRNQFRGPGYWNVDFSLFRAFPIGASGKRVEFRAEVFNLFNHPKWGNPDTDLTSSTFGQTFSVADGGGAGPNGTGARDFGSGERQVRLGIRFQF